MNKIYDHLQDFRDVVYGTEFVAIYDEFRFRHQHNFFSHDVSSTTHLSLFQDQGAQRVEIAYARSYRKNSQIFTFVDPPRFGI